MNPLHATVDKYHTLLLKTYWH